MHFSLTGQPAEVSTLGEATRKFTFSKGAHLMSIAVYRGVKYNTDIPKKEYEKWYFQTHSVNHQDNTYRGIHYAPSKNKEAAK